jgi:hypothetical protein
MPLVTSRHTGQSPAVSTSQMYWATQWHHVQQSKILLEKLTITQLLKKLPRLLWNPHVHYRHPNSRIAHTLNLSLRRSVLMLSTHQGLGLPGGLFPSSIMKENYTCISYPFLGVCYMPAPSHCTFLDHPSHIQSRVTITKLLLMQFSPVICVFLPFFSTLWQTVMMVMSVTVAQYTCTYTHIPDGMVSHPTTE